MPHIEFTQDGPVGIMTLNNPPLNLIDRQFMDEAAAVVSEIEAADIRALLLRAEGEHFSGGADVHVFKGLSQHEARAILTPVVANLQRLERLPFPTVAAVHGMCLAGGLELALACDMMWAAESTRFGQAEAVIGAIPFGGRAQRLAERAGSARAREIVYRAALYDAQTFERWNIVNRVVPDAELQAKALKFAHDLANGPTRAHAATKRLLREYVDTGTTAADALIVDLAPPLFESNDMRGGIDSLLETGPGNATFTGT